MNAIAVAAVSILDTSVLASMISFDVEITVTGFSVVSIRGKSLMVAEFMPSLVLETNVTMVAAVLVVSFVT